MMSLRHHRPYGGGSKLGQQSEVWIIRGRDDRVEVVDDYSRSFVGLIMHRTEGVLTARLTSNANMYPEASSIRLIMFVWQLEPPVWQDSERAWIKTAQEMFSASNKTSEKVISLPGI